MTVPGNPGTTFNIAARSWPAGTTAVGPVSIPAGVTTAHFAIVDSTWATDSVGLIGNCAIDLSTDGGATWQSAMNADFVGGPNPPSFGVSGPNGISGQARGRVTLNQATTFGWQVTLS